VAADGSVLIADTYNHRVRRVWPDGMITTVAGNGQGGFGGDGGQATQTNLDVDGVAVAADGRLLIVNSFYNRILQVGLDGTIKTVVGNGKLGFSGDGGPATQAGLEFPEDVAVAADGSVLIASTFDHRIRRVGPDGYGGPYCQDKNHQSLS
jgi:hypothetical protein